jgi:hypothetical protein
MKRKAVKNKMIFHDRFKWKKRVVGHLISDTNHEELHQFAAKIGLKIPDESGPGWFQIKPNPKYSHYDLTTISAIKRAEQAGAIEISSKELLEKMNALNIEVNHG